MKVKFFAGFASITKEKERDFQAGNAKELFEKIITHYGDDMREKLMPGGVLPESLVILVNGKHIRHLNGMETALTEEDVVSIFPMVSGG
jgi:molybdopterin synthase sulfur carrier subunit